MPNWQAPWNPHGLSLTSQWRGRNHQGVQENLVGPQ